jgi:hypothetical protein
MDELDRFKSEINLTEYAASRGYRLDRRESSRNSVVMRHPATDDKIIIARSPRDGHWIYFSVRDDRDHGTIIDFVHRRDHGTLGDVRRELAPWIGACHPRVPTQLYRSTVSTRTVDRATVERAFEGARLVANCRYLNQRGITPETLGSERFSGTFREDVRGNVLFPHRDPHGLTGFESKNHHWTSFATGGVKALWQSRCFADDRRLVLVESAIDALSFHQLEPDPRTRYASTAGALSEHQRGLLRDALETLPTDSIVVLAFDRDAAGDRLADQVRAIGGPEFVRACSPIGKDWNDCLTERERHYIRALGLARSLSRGR